jgi:hypothetical protein
LTAILGCAGASAIILCTFLPLTGQTGRFAFVQSNTLIQHDGWEFIALGVGGLCAVLLSYQAKRGGGWVVSIGMLTLLDLLYVGTKASNFDLYPIGLDGQPNASAVPVRAPVGISLYVGVAGALVLLLAGVIAVRSPPVEAEAPSRSCPFCAESILAAAVVCKHCHRDLPAATPAVPDMLA